MHAMQLPVSQNVLYPCPNLPFTNPHPRHENQPRAQHNAPSTKPHNPRKTTIIRSYQGPCNRRPRQPTISLTLPPQVKGGSVRN